MFEYAEKFLKISVGLGILAAGAGIGYHYGIYLPQIEREKIAKAEQSEINLSSQRREARENYSICVSVSEELYLTEWSDNCKLSGVDSKKSKCSLPASISNNINGTLEERKSRCLEIFKAEI